MNEKVKLAAAILIALAGFVGYYVLADNIMAARLGVLVLGLVLGGIVAWFTETGKQFLTFVQESWAEAKKVVWPTRKETLQTTGVVFLMVVAMAIFLWAVDWVLWEIAKFFMGRSD